MDDAVTIVECPRDAWQGLPVQMPATIKAEYLRRLIDAGFTRIDAVSFVSPRAVPQMADSEQVLELLDPPDDVELIGIVMNAKGAERAIATGAIKTLGFPYSICEEFLKRNQDQTLEESLDALEAVGARAYEAGLDVIAYVSMAFGNPYGEPWSLDELTVACELLADSGIEEIVLADTVGLATPEQIRETMTHLIALQSKTQFGIHLHTQPDDAPARIRAAYEAGCRRFDSTIGGLGGCPFAQDVLLGNLSTELLLDELKRLGAEIPALHPLDELIQANAEIERHFSSAVN